VGYVLAALLACGAAHADDPPDWQEAKRLRDRGAAAIARGDFGEALSDFTRAYNLHPTPNLRYNVAVALDKLGYAAEAVDAYEDFLGLAPHAPAEARAFADQRVNELQEQIGRLDIEVRPLDANITVDGAAVLMPRSRSLPLAAGEHTIAVERAGYQTDRERVVLIAGERRRIDLTLEPARAVVVAPTPPAPRATVPSTAATAIRSRSGRAAKLAGATLIAAGGAVLIAAGVFTALAQAADRRYLKPSDDIYSPSAYADRERYTTLDLVSFSVSGALLLGGATLYAVGRRRSGRWSLRADHEAHPGALASGLRP
jgi:hypothetical protein